LCPVPQAICSLLFMVKALIIKGHPYSKAYM
jgi:hypothetical protein